MSFLVDQINLRWSWGIQMKVFKCLAGNVWAKYTDQGLGWNLPRGVKIKREKKEVGKKKAKKNRKKEQLQKCELSQFTLISYYQITI